MQKTKKYLNDNDNNNNNNIPHTQTTIDSTPLAANPIHYLIPTTTTTCRHLTIPVMSPTQVSLSTDCCCYCYCCSRTGPLVVSTCQVPYPCLCCCCCCCCWYYCCCYIYYSIIVVPDIVVITVVVIKEL